MAPRVRLSRATDGGAGPAVGAGTLAGHLAGVVATMAVRAALCARWPASDRI
eukprot:SAG22_NODE_1260_length_4978_cov_36.695269_2_plen_52_part_00